MKEKYVAFDCESGGLDPETSSLLTVYFGIYNSDFKLMDELDLILKPNDGVYKVTAGALAVNRINLIKHDTDALTYEYASKSLHTFLNTHSSSRSYLVPIGHNVDFDLNFIHTYLLDKVIWSKYVTHRKLDTLTTSRFLRLAGILPQSSAGGLNKLAKSLDVAYEGYALHTAKGDVEITIECLKKMLERCTKNELTTY